MKLMLYRANRGTWLDKAINLLSGWYGYSHCELLFSDGMSFSSSPREGKCRFKSITYGDKWYEVELYNITPEKEAQIRYECSRYVGKKYDYLGIFLWFLIPVGIEDGSRWWCSEICSKLLGLRSYKISPNRLAEMFKAPRILPWEG